MDIRESLASRHRYEKIDIGETRNRQQHSLGLQMPSGFYE